MIERRESFNEWFDGMIDTDEERSNVKTLAEHGADSGVSGIIWTYECVHIHDQFEREIWETMLEDAKELGLNYGEEILLKCKRKDMLEDYESSKTLKVWYMCERRAHQKYNDEELWDTAEEE